MNSSEGENFGRKTEKRGNQLSSTPTGTLACIRILKIHYNGKKTNVEWMNGG